MEEYDAKRAILAQKSQEHYDRSAKTLAPLKIGNKVMVQNTQTKVWDRIGNIVQIGPHRKYQVKFPSGRCLWRNRRFLRPIPQDDCISKKEEEKDDGTNVESQDKSRKEKPRRSKRVRFKVDRLNYTH